MKKFNVNLDLDTETTPQQDPKHPLSKSTETSKTTTSTALIKKKEEPQFLKARIISSTSIMLKSASTPMTQKTSARAKIIKTNNNNAHNMIGSKAIIVKG